MANVVITPLEPTAFNGSFVNTLNNNLIKLANALNDGVLWRNDVASGQTSMQTDLNLNGYSIVNATLGGEAFPVLELIARLKQAEADIADLQKKLKAK